MDKNGEEQIINGLRELMMKRLEHFRDYSARGPVFPENSSSLEAFLPAMKDIARSLSDWIIRETEQVVVLEEEVPRVVPVVAPKVAAPEAVPLYKRVARCLRGNKERRIWPLNFFYEAIDLARELVDEIEENGKHMMVICPSLQTLDEIIELYAIVDKSLKWIGDKFMEQKQFALKEDERHALRHARHMNALQRMRARG